MFLLYLSVLGITTLQSYGENSMNKKYFITIMILQMILIAMLVYAILHGNFYCLLVDIAVAILFLLVLLYLHHKKYLPDFYKYWIYLDYVLTVFPIWVLFFSMCITIL